MTGTRGKEKGGRVFTPSRLYCLFYRTYSRPGRRTAPAFRNGQKLAFRVSNIGCTLIQDFSASKLEGSVLPAAFDWNAMV